MTDLAISSQAKGTSTAARAQRHRAKLAAEGCARLDITIGKGSADRMRELAQRRDCPLWKVIEDACDAYWRAYSDVSGNGG